LFEKFTLQKKGGLLNGPPFFIEKVQLRKRYSPVLTRIENRYFGSVFCVDCFDKFVCCQSISSWGEVNAIQ
jgi:hypothetical protein